MKRHHLSILSVTSLSVTSAVSGGLALLFAGCELPTTTTIQSNVVCASGGTTGMGGPDAGAPPPSDAGTVRRDAGTPFVPGPPYMAPAHSGNLIHVKNGCSFPLWMHGVGGGATLSPDNMKLNAGDQHDYSVGDWPFAYIYAYLDGPQMNLIERAEVTFFPAALVSYKLGYSDGIGLPMELQAIGTGADCKRVGCYITQAQVLSQCPDGLLSGKRCLSAGEYCAVSGNAAKPYCHALDTTIASCVQSTPMCGGIAGATTTDVYRCEHALGDKADLCAALNRGVGNDPTNANEAAHYRSAASNSYAAWIHDVCPGLYAFPYDDARAAVDAFHACQTGSNNTQLNITFCPAG